MDDKGNKISVGCLLRIEANLQVFNIEITYQFNKFIPFFYKAKAYRVTIRAVHSSLSKATAMILKIQLST